MRLHSKRGNIRSMSGGFIVRWGPEDKREVGVLGGWAAGSLGGAGEILADFKLAGWLVYLRGRG